MGGFGSAERTAWGGRPPTAGACTPGAQQADTAAWVAPRLPLYWVTRDSYSRGAHLAPLQKDSVPHEGRGAGPWQWPRCEHTARAP